jgi:hypothetical protein
MSMKASIRVEASITSLGTMYYSVYMPSGSSKHPAGFVHSKHVDVALSNARRDIDENTEFKTVGPGTYNADGNRFEVSLERSPVVIRTGDLNEALRKLGVDVQREDDVTVSYANAEVRVRRWAGDAESLTRYEIRD